MSHLCNGCHDLMQKAINFNNAAIVSAKGSDYRIHFWYTSENEAINIMKTSDWMKKVDYYIFFNYIEKWVKQLIIIEK